jgi:hypothetical protein
MIFRCQSAMFRKVKEHWVVTSETEDARTISQ